jgi:hypothetical protein
MLRQIGVAVAKASEPGTCHQRFIVDYRRYLLRERGLAEATLVYFVRFAEQFLSARFGNGDLNLSELCAVLNSLTSPRSRRVYQYFSTVSSISLRSFLNVSTRSAFLRSG